MVFTSMLKGLMTSPQPRVTCLPQEGQAHSSLTTLQVLEGKSVALVEALVGCFCFCPQLIFFSLSFLDSQTLFPLAGSLQSRAVDWQNIGHYGKDEGRTHRRSRVPFPSCLLMHVSDSVKFSAHSSSLPLPYAKAEISSHFTAC